MIDPYILKCFKDFSNHEFPKLLENITQYYMHSDICIMFKSSHQLHITASHFIVTSHFITASRFNFFATGNILLCDQSFELALYISMCVV